MSQSSAWWRTGAGIAAWLILAVVTAGVAWAAVAVVANQGDDPASVRVPSSRTAGSTTPPRDTTSAPTPGATSPSGDGGTSGAGSSRVLASRAGTVSVVCTGASTIKLLYATPADGWQISENESEPDEVRIEFSNGDDDLRTRAECDGGVVEGEAESD